MPYDAPMDHLAGVSALLIDFEGTLVGFQWQLEAGEADLRRTMVEHGFDAAAIARESYAEMWNRALRGAGSSGSRADLERWLQPVYDRWDADAATRWQPRETAAELLVRLRAGGMPVGVVSNVGAKWVDETLGKFALRELIDVLVSRNDVELMKPAGEGLRKAAELLGTSPSAALMVGDSVTDVLAARDAGARVAIIRGGESTSTAFAANPPDLYVERLVDVADLLGL